MIEFKNVKVTGLMTAMMLATSLAGAASANDQEAVNGYWVSEDKASVVEVKPCTDGARRLCGDVVWAKDGIGENTQMLKGLRASKGNLSSGNLWNKGKFVDLESGKKRTGKIELLADGTLKISACNKRGLCQNDIWQRPDGEMTAMLETIKVASR